MHNRRMQAERRGTYMVIEGPDGSGKTTQKDLLLQKLRSMNKDAVDLIEPGGTPLGKELRTLILDPSIVKQPESELDLFTVARRELVQQILRPSLEAGKIVISDRNWFSSVAYQGYGRSLALEKIISRSKEAMGQYFMPDVAVVLSVPIEVTAERIKQAGKKADWFEQLGPDFFARVQEGYSWMVDEYQLTVIDGTKSIEAVHSDLLRLLRQSGAI